MKRKIEPEEDEEESEFEEDDEEDTEEDIIPVEPKQKVRKFAKPAPKSLKQKTAVAPKQRFAAFSYPERVGVYDVETNEICGEGELAVLQILAKVLETQERIENTLGSMMES